MIRRLQNNEKQVAVNIREVFQKSYAVEAAILQAKDFPPLQRSLEHFIDCHNIFYGYFEKQQLAAVVELVHHKNSVHIQSLVVKPLFFRQGIAGKLLEFIFKTFNVVLFTVETGLKNKPATTLYLKYGFKEVLQFDTDHGVRKVRFEKEIKC